MPGEASGLRGAFDRCIGTRRVARPASVGPPGGGAGGAGSAAERRASSHHDAGRASRTFRPGCIAAAFLLAVFACPTTPYASAQGLSAEEFWNEHVGSDATAPRIVSVERNRPSPTVYSPLGFHVTFSEPVLADPGDFKALGEPDAWFRVGLRIEPHYEEQRRLMDAGDPFYKPCRPDWARLSHLDVGPRLQLTGRLVRECMRRKNMSRHWQVLASGGDIALTVYAEVSLAVAPDHDLEDAHGNLLDSTLPTGDAYQGYVIDRRGPNAYLSASPATHDGSTPVTITVNFYEPVTGFRAGDLFLRNGTVTGFAGSDGDSVYTVTVKPTGSSRIIARAPPGIAADLEGRASDPSGFLWVLYDPLGVTFSNLALSVPEGGSETYTAVLRSRPSANVTVTATPAPAGDDDISASPASLTFTPGNWSVPQTFTVTAREDTDSVNGTRTIAHGVSTTDTDYAALSLPSLTATEADNDGPAPGPAAGVTVSSAMLSVPEGSERTYTVVLDARPGADVRISPTITGDAHLTVTPATRTFTPVNWNTTQDFTVSAAEDADAVDGTATIAHTASSADGGYNGISIASVAVTEDDNDLTDSAAPTVLSVERDDGAGNDPGEDTNADTLNFRVTFSESVRNVDTGDFSASGAAAIATGVSGSGAVYVVTVGGGNLGGYHGTVGLTFASGQNIEDTAGNALADTGPSGVNQTYTLENTAPRIVSIERDDGKGNGDDPGEITNADSLEFRVTFSEPVSRVNAPDFDATGTTGGVREFSRRTGTVVTLTVSGGDLDHYDGEVGLALSSALNIEDKAGNALDRTLPAGANYETYTLDNTAPRLHSVERHDGTTEFDRSTNADTLKFRVTITEDVENVGVATFDPTGTTATPTQVTGSGAVYIVTVGGGNLAEYDGEVGLAVASGHNVADAAGNPLAPITFAKGQKYRLDNTAPRIISVKRGKEDGNDPGAVTSADTLDFRVTFSEPVEKVGAADFNATGTTGDVHEFSERTRTAVTLTVSRGDLDRYDGEVGLILDTGEGGLLNIEDKVGNALDTTLPTGTNYETYTLDNAGGASGTEAPDPGLQARFGVQPAWHTGMPFWTELHFSAEPDIGYKDLRDKAFEVTGARITRAQRIDKGSSRSWRLLVEPSGFGDVSLTLPVTEDCAAEGAVCTKEGAPPRDGPWPGGAGTGRPAGGAAEGHDVARRRVVLSQAALQPRAEPELPERGATVCSR